MNANLIRWSTVVGAIPRIVHYREILSRAKSYFDRLRIVNEALGPHWVFRLVDAVGLDVISKNRPSWVRFYVDDIDRLHCPLDPGAPETEAYLGTDYSVMDMAFYAGMGFDGYRLALETQRDICLQTKQINFDDRYVLVPSDELRTKLDAYDTNRFIPKEDYYAAYSDALNALHESAQQIVSMPSSPSENALERTAAGCLIVMCGGHQGCNNHPIKPEEFRAQMESLIVFHHGRNVLIGSQSLAESEHPRIRVAG